MEMRMTRLLIRSIFLAALCLFVFSTTIFAQGKFVYTNNDRKGSNSVSGFKVLADGKLELLPGMPNETGHGGGDAVAVLSSAYKILVVEKGPFLYAVNDGDQSISAYGINSGSGALTFINNYDTGDGGDDDSLSIA